MLLVIGLSAEEGDFPVDALRQVDSTLAPSGFKKEVSSVVTARKAYSLTYEGPNVDKGVIENLLKPLLAQHHLTVSIETEESVRFP